jgi:hypothetical protein
MSSQNIEALIEATKHLAPDDKELLRRALAQGPPSQRHHITELRGLGKELWQGIDAQDYVNAERDSWDI